MIKSARFSLFNVILVFFLATCTKKKISDSFQQLLVGHPVPVDLKLI